MADNAYTRNGYRNREDYLSGIADDFGIAPMVVFELSAMLGAEEDFDGLISSLNDFPVERISADEMEAV